MVDRSYCTAADMARETGYHRSTVVGWIKAGRIRSVKKRTSRSVYRIYQKYFATGFIKKLKKSDRRHGTTWTAAELCVLGNNMGKGLDSLTAMLPGRTRSAICVRRSRERRRQ